MTKRQQPDRDDEDFEAYLRGEDALAAELGGVEQPTPSPELDARVQPEAPAPSARAAEDAQERALVTSPLGRWRTPLVLLAIVAVAAAVGLQWGHWGAPAPQSPPQVRSGP